MQVAHIDNILTINFVQKFLFFAIRCVSEQWHGNMQRTLSIAECRHHGKQNSVSVHLLLGGKCLVLQFVRLLVFLME